MATPSCPRCREPFDLQTRRLRQLPCGHCYCRACLLDMALAPDERPPLPELPDEILVEVFSRLPTRTLLGTVRAVCRRWRHLAVQPAVWSHRTLAVSVSKDDMKARVILSIAPKLHQLSCKASKPKAHDKVSSTASTTRCAATRLDIAFFCNRLLNSQQSPQTELCRIFRRQVELGKLQAVKLEEVPREYAVCLVNTALRYAKLKELHLQIDKVPDGQAVAALSSKQYCSSVESLTYHSPFSDSEQDDPLLEFLLDTLAGSLQSLDIGPHLPPRAAELIGRCSQLRRAQLPAVGGLAGLDRCPLLTELHLSQFCTSPAALVPFFRSASASRLKKLTFDDDEGIHDSRSLIDVVSALSTSGNSLLEELDIRYINSHSRDADLAALPGALCGLRHLHTLLLSNLPVPVPGASLPDLITPEGAPSLRWLGIMGVDDKWHGCSGQEYCRLPAWYDLVRRNPSIHVTGLPLSDSCADRGNESCDCCRRGLHPYGTFDTLHMSLYAHPEGAPCDLPVHSKDPALCPSDGSYGCCAHVWVCAGVQ